MAHSHRLLGSNPPKNAVLSGWATRTKPQAPRSLRRWLARTFAAGIGCESQKVSNCDPLSQEDARRARAPQLLRGHDTAYLRFVERFAQHFGKSPDKLGPDHIRSYQAYLLKAMKMDPGTVENHVAALRFLFVNTLSPKIPITAKC
jgi:hypothetical protein